MRIADIYESIQGEGLLTGTRSVFVRASGCNLRCRYCDTPYTSWQSEGEDLSIDQILDHVASWSPSHVIVTGGEPMLYAELVPLCELMRQRRWHITIETAGTLYLPLQCDLISISPKLPNSTPSPEAAPRWHARHEKTRHAPRVIRRLISQYAYQVKFVIAARTDCDEVKSYLREIPELDQQLVMLMPEGTDPARLDAIAAWLQPYCAQHGWLFCPRRQIEWFGGLRGT